MTELILEIEPAVIDSFPEIIVGGFLVNNLNLAVPQMGTTTAAMQAAHAALMDRGLDMQKIADEPCIGHWRTAYKTMGLKPSTFKCSVEALARRLLRGEPISTPLTVVNAYCAVSTRYLSPLGGYDLTSLPLPRVDVRFASPSDRFSPLGGRAEDMPLSPKVVVYGSSQEVLCWAFNHRDSKITCLTPQTCQAVFFSEGVAEDHHEGSKDALEEMRALLTSAGASAGRVHFVTQRNTRVVLSTEG